MSAGWGGRRMDGVLAWSKSVGATQVESVRVATYPGIEEHPSKHIDLLPSSHHAKALLLTQQSMEQVAT